MHIAVEELTKSSAWDGQIVLVFCINLFSLCIRNVNA
jgi:hypothetical protein